MKIQRYSRLAKANWNEDYVADEISFWDTQFDLTIEQQDGDIYYQVRQNDRLDKIASWYYRRPELWWIVAQANKMMLGLTELKVGDFLRVPSPDYVLNTLLK